MPCLCNGTATTFNLDDFLGKFVLLLFQPVDFGYIGPTELDLLDNLGSDCEVLTSTSQIDGHHFHTFYCKKCCLKVVAITSGSVVGKQAFLTTPRYVCSAMYHCSATKSKGTMV